jgi:hypothetical protein
MFNPEYIDLFESWVNDDDGWNLFARDYMRVKLDPQQDELLYIIRNNQKTTAASGTSRGKDYTMAVAGMCFMYTTPYFEDDKMTGNTKVILTGPTDRQVKKIMIPEIARIFKGSNYLPGVISDSGIKTPYTEWYLLGFKADDKNTEAWTGYHAANIFFGVTEASGMDQKVFDAIEGNLQGNSRLVIVFNPNINHGYAASSFKNPAFKKVRLNSLDAPNVTTKKIIHPGQVDYQWITGRLKDWCQPIFKTEMRAEEGDFEFEEKWYRPNDLFRAKVLGLFPKVSEGVLVPPEWIELANNRWKLQQEQNWEIKSPLRLGVDVAGMGRDNSCFCNRYGDFVEKFESMNGGGAAIHMEVTGKIIDLMKKQTDDFIGRYAQSFIDTIGEGAGVYSRMQELTTEVVHTTVPNAWLKDKFHSCKFSEAATDDGDKPLKDSTGVYEFLNMRAWLYWAVRDWLDPNKNSKAMLPVDDELLQELSETQWKFRSDGKIQIEAKEDIKKRIKRSPDKADSLANTFWPVPDIIVGPKKKKNIAQFFH